MRTIPVRAVVVDTEICTERSVEHADRLATGLEGAKTTKMDRFMARIDRPGRHDRRDHGARAGM